MSSPSPVSDNLSDQSDVTSTSIRLGVGHDRRDGAVDDFLESRMSTNLIHYLPVATTVLPAD